MDDYKGFENETQELDAPEQEAAAKAPKGKAILIIVLIVLVAGAGVVLLLFNGGGKNSDGGNPGSASDSYVNYGSGSVSIGYTDVLSEKGSTKVLYNPDDNSLSVENEVVGYFGLTLPDGITLETSTFLNGTPYGELYFINEGGSQIFRMAFQNALPNGGKPEGFEEKTFGETGMWVSYREEKNYYILSNPDYSVLITGIRDKDIVEGVLANFEVLNPSSLGHLDDAAIEETPEPEAIAGENKGGE